MLTDMIIFRAAMGAQTSAATEEFERAKREAAAQREAARKQAKRS